MTTIPLLGDERLVSRLRSAFINRPNPGGIAGVGLSSSLAPLDSTTGD
jgi:hypothetical protein